MMAPGFDLHDTDRCNAELHIADDFGDNHATIRCELEPGHEGLHEENFIRYGLPVQIRFACDQRGE